MSLHLGRVAALRNLLLVAGVIFFAGAASAAFYSDPKEFTYPDDNFAVLSHADPKIDTQPDPAPGRIYQFISPAFGRGILFTVNVSTTAVKPELSEKDWLCRVARNSQDVVSVTQSGLKGIQVIDDQTMQGNVVVSRAFIKDKKIYVVSSWGEDPKYPSDFAGRADMMWEFLNSWRLLDAPKNQPLPKVGEAVSCATNSKTQSH